MKKHIIWLLVGLLVLVLGVCGLKSLDSKISMPLFGNSTSVEVNTKVTDVDNLIGKISSPVTLDSEASITAARTAYDALSDADKAKVTNLSALEEAEVTLAKLKETSGDAASSVDDLITQISSPVTLDSEIAITAARSAYDALSDTDKAKVTNLSVLEEAEASLAKLKESSTTTSYAEGDIVTFLGGNVYVSSFATDPANELGQSQCKVTVVAEGAAHAYHLISTDGAGVYGWVDAERIQK